MHQSGLRYRHGDYVVGSAFFRNSFDVICSLLSIFLYIEVSYNIETVVSCLDDAAAFFFVQTQ